MSGSFLCPSPNLSKNFILYNFQFADSPILFTDAIFNADTSMAGLSFIFSDFKANIICAGSSRSHVSSYVEAAASSLCFALQNEANGVRNVKTILCPCAELVRVVQTGDCMDDWRLNLQIEVIKGIMDTLLVPKILFVPSDWNRAARSLAIHGLNHHEISLFHHGRELPRWLMKTFNLSGLSF